MQTGLQTISGNTYYFNEDGTMFTGTIIIGSYQYTFNASGVMTSKERGSISLDVVSYKQYDSTWASVSLGSSTIKASGCLVTALAMLYSYTNSTTCTPITMKNKLTFTSDGSLASWAQVTNLGYTVNTYSSASVTTSILEIIYAQLAKGNPVVIGCKTASGGQHYVTITGYTGGDTLSTSSFTINDPGSSTRTLLSEYLAVYPYLYKLIY